MNPEPRLKTISEICIEADAAKDDLNRLNELSEYVRQNGRKYSLINLRYVQEHLSELARELGRRDADKMLSSLGL